MLPTETQLVTTPPKAEPLPIPKLKIAEKIEGTYPLYEKEEHKFSLMFFKQLFGKGVTR